MLDAIEKLGQRRIISQDEATQLTSAVFDAYPGSVDDNLLDQLFIKVSECVETVKFEQARLDQILAGKLLVRLSTNCRNLEYFAPVLAEDGSSDR